MLFRTVYGPELEAIYQFIAGADTPLARSEIQTTFLANTQPKEVSTQSVDDALSFLESACLVEEKKGYYHKVGDSTPEPFRVKVLGRLRSLEVGRLEPRQPIDRLYMLILTELFISPNRLFVADVHTEANKLRQVTEVGGLSREKLQAWKRVMEFMGIGQRTATGFRCAYSPQLMLAMRKQWPDTENSLQQFFEAYLGKYLPYQTVMGDLAMAVEAPLRHLHQRGDITLSLRQDSPSKPYFGEQKFRYIARREVINVAD